MSMPLRTVPSYVLNQLLDITRYSVTPFIFFRAQFSSHFCGYQQDLCSVLAVAVISTLPGCAAVLLLRIPSRYKP
jgi:hypothetical protein